jgi:hypothetical protein
MFKKFMSKALLSMVLDKKARDKLSPSKDSEPADVWDQGAQAAPPRPSEPEMTREETETLIKQSLDFAERKLSQSGPMTAGRQSLISQAMAVHKSKTGLFNDLNQEQREKLYVVAMKSFKLDPGPKGGKGGGR